MIVELFRRTRVQPDHVLEEVTRIDFSVGGSQYTISQHPDAVNEQGTFIINRRSGGRMTIRPVVSNEILVSSTIEDH